MKLKAAQTGLFAFFIALAAIFSNVATGVATSGPGWNCKPAPAVGATSAGAGSSPACGGKIRVATEQSPRAGTAGVTAFSDTAQVTGQTGGLAGERVIFKLFGPFSSAPPESFCVNGAPTPVFESTGKLAPDPKVHGQLDASSGGYTPGMAGTYYWVAYVPGDHPGDQAIADWRTGGHEGAHSGCLGEPITVCKARPGISTAATTAGPPKVGLETVTDTATIAGAAGDLSSESVTFWLWGPYSEGATPTCKAGEGQPLLVTTARLVPAGAGTWTATTAPYKPAAAGRYVWTAAYPGDASNEPVSEKCNGEHEGFTVPDRRVRISTTASPTTPIVAGTPATVGDVAKLSGGYHPTGELVFKLYKDSECETAPLLTLSAILPNASVSATWTPARTGTYYWGVRYLGDSNNDPGSLCGGPNETLTVVGAGPTLSTRATNPEAPIVVGTTVTLSDTGILAGGHEPTGTVTFTLNGPATGPGASCGPPVLGPITAAVRSKTESAATGSQGFTPAQAGTYYWLASYSGDARNPGTKGTVGCGDPNEAVTVVKASPAVATTPSATAIDQNQTASDVAVVSGGFNPTGTVTFHLYDYGLDSTCSTDLLAGDGSFQGIALAGGKATSPAYKFTKGGLFQWVASYSGDGNNNTALGRCGDTSEQVVVTPVEAIVTPAPTGTPQVVLMALGLPLLLLSLILFLLSRRRGREAEEGR